MMKTTFQTNRGGGALLAALALALSPAHTALPQGRSTNEEAPGTADAASTPSDKFDAVKFLGEPIPELRINEGTPVAAVIETLRNQYGNHINAVYRDDADSIKVPALDLRNVSLESLLEVIEALTDVKADIITSSREANPIICFIGPKNPVLVPKVTHRSTESTQTVPGMVGAQNLTKPAAPGIAQAHQLGGGGEMQAAAIRLRQASDILKIDPSAKWSDVVRQIQVRNLQPLDSSAHTRVFRLSGLDANPEDVIDFIEQILALGAEDKDKKFPAVRTLYHTGTKSLIVRGSAVQISEIEEALKELGGGARHADPFGTGAPGDGASSLKKAVRDAYRQSGTTRPDPFGGGNASGREISPFSEGKKPAKPPKKAEDDPFG